MQVPSGPKKLNIENTFALCFFGENSENKVNA